MIWHSNKTMTEGLRDFAAKFEILDKRESRLKPGDKNSLELQQLAEDETDTWKDFKYFIDKLRRRKYVHPRRPKNKSSLRHGDRRPRRCFHSFDVVRSPES